MHKKSKNAEFPLGTSIIRVCMSHGLTVDNKCCGECRTTGWIEKAEDSRQNLKDGTLPSGVSKKRCGNV